MNVGIVMASSKSARFPNKNIQLLNGLHLFDYPLQTLLDSGTCDKVILSTDSVKYRKIASKYPFDHIIMRNPEWDYYPQNMENALEQSVLLYEQVKGELTDLCMFIGGNCMFIRPSWFRVAVDIIRNYYYNEKPVHMVTSDERTVPFGVFQSHTTRVHPSTFVLQNHSIVCDIDFEQEFIEASDIQTALTDGKIKYPRQERFHEEIFQNNYKDLGLRMKASGREYIDV